MYIGAIYIVDGDLKACMKSSRGTCEHCSEYFNSVRSHRLMRVEGLGCMLSELSAEVYIHEVA